MLFIRPLSASLGVPMSMPVPRIVVEVRKVRRDNIFNLISLMVIPLECRAAQRTSASQPNGYVSLRAWNSKSFQKFYNTYTVNIRKNAGFSAGHFFFSRNFLWQALQVLASFPKVRRSDFAFFVFSALLARSWARYKVFGDSVKSVPILPNIRLRPGWFLQATFGKLTGHFRAVLRNGCRGS